MAQKIRVGAVSYLNTKPLLYGIAHSDVHNEIELQLDYPARLAASLKAGDIDMALLPVAAMHDIAGARVVSDYGIATDGNVVSVALFSQVPIEEVEAVYLDYQSRTSVRLAEVLLQRYWKKQVTYKQANEGYIADIKGGTAGVIIGDRALEQLPNFAYSYDLSAAWKALTGLDFVFAAWIANKELPAGFLDKFNAANAEGLRHFDTVISENPFPAYDLNVYYKENIKYLLDEQKLKGMQQFLTFLRPG